MGKDPKPEESPVLFTAGVSPSFHQVKREAEDGADDSSGQSSQCFLAEIDGEGRMPMPIGCSGACLVRGHDCKTRLPNCYVDR